MPPVIQMENKVIVPSSFLFWLACAVHVTTGYPYPFATWVELLLWGAFLAPFAAIVLYALREVVQYMREDH